MRKSLRSAQGAGCRLASSRSLADSSSEQNQDSRITSVEVSKESMTHHDVDFDAHVDHGTSYALRTILLPIH